MTAREWKVKLWERINAWSACRDNIQKKIPIVVEIDLLIEKALTEAVAEERERICKEAIALANECGCGPTDFCENFSCHSFIEFAAAIRKVKP